MADYLTVKEFAKRFHFSERQVRRMIRDGRAQAVQFGRAYRIEDKPPTRGGHPAQGTVVTSAKPAGPPGVSTIPQQGSGHPASGNTVAKGPHPQKRDSGKQERTDYFKRLIGE